MGPSTAYAGDHVELSDNGDDFASTIGIGAIVSTKFTWPRDPKPQNNFLLTTSARAGMAQVDRALQRKAASRGALSGRALRYRLRPARSPCHREGWPVPLRVLRRSLGRPGRATGAWQGALHGCRHLDRPDDRLRIGYGKSVIGLVRAVPPARGDAARWDVTMSGAVPGPKAWLLYAFATTILWGLWGAFTGLSGGARLSRNAGLLRLVAHDDPAGALCARARRLAARARPALDRLRPDHRAARRRRSDGAVLCGDDGSRLSDLSGDLAVAGRDHRACPICCWRERTNIVGAAGIVLALLALPLFDFSSQGRADRRAGWAGSCFR